jgi:hypothetical protein
MGVLVGVTWFAGIRGMGEPGLRHAHPCAAFSRDVEDMDGIDLDATLDTGRSILIFPLPARCFRAPVRLSDQQSMEAPRATSPGCARW